MIRLKLWRALALAVFAAALPAHAGEVYQISTISSLLAGGYDGDTTVAELLRHGSFGVGDLQRALWGNDGARWPGLPRHDRRPCACGRRFGADPICGGCRVPPAGVRP